MELVMLLETWWVFFAACWAISLSPGAGAIASMSSGLHYGFWRGYWNVLGLQLALVLQVLIVAAGVGAFLAASEWGFAVIKWFGVAYLLWLAGLQWRALPVDLQAAASTRGPGQPLSLLVRGFLVNASNPKALVFILAVLPQFLRPQAPIAEQYLVMASTMIAVDLVVMAVYTGLAARVLRALRTPRQQRLMNRIFAGLFVVAALLLAGLRQVS
jgi:homoserine/homoserine lactone efflux protein